jgi:hypothetical protein
MQNYTLNSIVNVIKYILHILIKYSYAFGYPEGEVGKGLGG